MALSLEQPGKGPLAPLSRREFDELTRRGVLDDARVELLYGRVVSMSPQGGAHSYGVTELARGARPCRRKQGARPHPDAARGLGLFGA
jgi:Uma2 family endonuclease